MTYLWQEEARKPYYRIQTKDSNVARKLRNRDSCNLAIKGVNDNLWVFTTQYYSPNKAIKSLGRVTGENVVKRTINGKLDCYTLPILDSRLGDESLNEKEIE